MSLMRRKLIILLLSVALIFYELWSIYFSSTSIDVWFGTIKFMKHRAAWALDPQLQTCFDEIPDVPDFWGLAPACPLGDKPGDFPDGTQRYAVLQYHWAPNVRPFSPKCAAYAEQTYMRNGVDNWYGTSGTWPTQEELDRPDPLKWKWGIEELPRVKLQHMHADDAGARTGSIGNKRSVLMTLFDGLGRATYNRLVAQSVLAAAADDYTVFDFTRFHIVGCCSARNTRAIYTGQVPEISESLRTGMSNPPDTDVDVCDEKDTTKLVHLCRQILWGRYRDHGYLTMSLEPTCSGCQPSLGQYFERCREVCVNITGPLLSVPMSATLSDPFKAAAGAFHSLATPEQPVFTTSLSNDPHNGWMNVHSIAYGMSTQVRALRHSAAQRAVPLPLVIFFSDHGTHFGEAADHSRMGRVEHKFATLVMLVPNALLDSDPALKHNLEKNRQRLISPFDLHHTLTEFASLSGEGVKGHTDKDETKTDNRNNDDGGSVITPRNLFREEVPLNRDCKDAGIEHIWCSCQGWTDVVSEDLAVLTLAGDAIASMNKLIKDNLRGVPCITQLRLRSVEDARISDSPPSIEFLLVVRPVSRTVKFRISMACNRKSVPREGGSQRGFVPSQLTACTLSSFFRYTGLSEAEDAAYIASGGAFGSQFVKLCVIEP